MREILFRGKRTDNGEWVEGYLIQNYDRDWFICDQMGKVDGPFKKVEYPFMGAHFCLYQVDPETIGQFTGLTDKNGKKIFEGDVVALKNYFDSEKRSNYSVIYEDGLFLCINPENGGMQYLNRVQYVDSIVIGNIHDDPELLEVVK